MNLLKLDIYTICILLFTGNISASILLLLYRRDASGRYRYTEFMTGRLLSGFAWLFIGLRGIIPLFVSVYLGNTLLITGIAFEAYAFTMINRKQPLWKYVYGSIAVAGSVLFCTVADTPNMRVAIASMAVMMLLFPASVNILVSRNLSGLKIIIGSIYSFFSFLLVIRSMYGFFYKGEFAVLTPGVIQSLTFLQPFFLLIFGVAGFILMTKEGDDRRLAQSEELYRTLVEQANEAIIIVREGRIAFSNDTLSKILGIPKEYIIGRDIAEFLHSEHREAVLDNYIKRVSGEYVPRVYDFKISDVNKNERWVTISSTKINWEHGSAVMALLTDITDRKKLESEREQMIDNLKVALADVKTLSGLLPICSSCKKIRDDKGYWNQIEVYIRDHSEADFSHSICPDCARKLYPEIKLKQA